MKINGGGNWHWHTVLWLTVFIQLWPLLFMISTSFKTMDQVFQSTLNPVPVPPVLDNYRYVLESLPLFSYIWNTLLIASIITIAKVTTSVLAGFAFVYYEFPLKEKIFNALLLTFLSQSPW